ncbi:MAG TPA: hypothetical protein PKW95_16700 [bacterium]|nr:hypothetical protein [bacterium]
MIAQRGGEKNWALKTLRGGELVAAAAPAIGGRIISLQYRGEELLFVQAERTGETFDFSAVDDLRAAKRAIGFGLWGGDKTWVAPQRAWVDGIPPLELDAAPYQVEEDGDAIVMTSPLCRETGLRVVRRVEVSAAGVLTLDETIRNDSDRPVRRGLWNVTQVLRPFDVYLPATALRPYPEEGDSVCLIDRFVERAGEWCKIVCRAPAHFKYGGFAQRGCVIALREEKETTLAFARTFAHPPVADYAHEAEVEVYNSPNHNYLEIELHAPWRELAPGESVGQRQRWHVFRVPGRVGPDEIFAKLESVP